MRILLLSNSARLVEGQRIVYMRPAQARRGTSVVPPDTGAVGFGEIHIAHDGDGTFSGYLLCNNDAGEPVNPDGGNADTSRGFAFAALIVTDSAGGLTACGGAITGLAVVYSDRHASIPTSADQVPAWPVARDGDFKSRASAAYRHRVQNVPA